MRSEGASPPAPLVVEVDRVTKIYRRPGSGWQRLGRLLAHRPAPEGFVALSDVSFALPRGEGFGVVGENGAGKSTLLKILAGVTSPTSGRTAVRGRLTSLLELGAGFHPDFSGRQNIQLTAALLGLSAAEVRDCTPQVLDFAELGADIDRPVRTYSSGMAMRLGFAIATSVAPDVLIVDEALSVGDGYFQKKCMDRLLAFVEGGGTLLFCSHAMYYISAFCRRVLWLHEGRMRALGETAEVVREYERYLLARSAAAAAAGETPAAAGQSAAGAAVPRAGARLTAVRQTRVTGEWPSYRSGEPFELEISWETDDPALAFHLGVGINRSDELEVFTFSTAWSGLEPFTGRRSHTVRLRLDELPLVKGDFILYIFLMDERLLHVFDRRIVRSAFSVTAERYEAGLFHAPHRWLVEEE
ncbi:MAG: ABC transporter ATP-binding protein [Thermoanaerobaculia bacterium]|nr:ABC transporter ATP-binding protein [Thermoanaerobaculia bacterium]MBP7812545.1 ABC transporter ATP-binding protein [Thermoanaerobaculia bacterium]MBP8844268.1 ABC transporter ATP-binding protein [Thermoanaerobaculia bacterium]HPA95034.1 ABC transporter ATP-binding protein [Thermoanaerobaculia bacterium]HQN38469.1 ABC transporter ATP-binding protein [Thermoanaerobaculia bacterium]